MVLGDRLRRCLGDRLLWRTLVDDSSTAEFAAASGDLLRKFAGTPDNRLVRTLCADHRFSQLRVRTGFGGIHDHKMVSGSMAYRSALPRNRRCQE